MSYLIFQTGHKAANWNINLFLRNIYWLLKDCPVRRFEYTQITGSKIFPLKFCTIRWLENSSVCERALQMLPFLKKWVDHIGTALHSEVYASIRKSLLDELLPEKLRFFKSISLNLEPFLEKFQTPKPMFPFLYEHFEAIIRTLLVRFVKDKVLQEASNFTKILELDLSTDSKQIISKVDIGFEASSALEPISNDKRHDFYQGCKLFLVKLTTKLLERCPLKYSFVCSASCLSPTLLKKKKELCKKRMQCLLQSLIQQNRITPETADIIKTQFHEFCSDESINEKIDIFSFNNDRLDVFYTDLIGKRDDMRQLFNVLKMMLILSHGNASVESGFSVNKDVLVENLEELSLISQRMVYDTVRHYGGALTVEFTSDLMKSARSARTRYRESLERKRTESKKNQFAEERKRKAKEAWDGLCAKREALRADAKANEDLIRKQMVHLRKEMDF